MVVSVKNLEGIKFFIEEVVKVVGVLLKEFIEYYEWKVNWEKLKKMKFMRMIKKEVKNFIFF